MTEARDDDAATTGAGTPDAAPGTVPDSPGGVDYQRMAADWDRALAALAPVTAALLAHLPTVAAGDLLLDVGCGTGEPGLSAARRNPGVRLLGVDTAAAMVEVVVAAVGVEPTRPLEWLADHAAGGRDGVG